MKLTFGIFCLPPRNVKGVLKSIAALMMTLSVVACERSEAQRPTPVMAEGKAAFVPLGGSLPPCVFNSVSVNRQTGEAVAWLDPDRGMTNVSMRVKPAIFAFLPAPGAGSKLQVIATQGPVSAFQWNEAGSSLQFLVSRQHLEQVDIEPRSITSMAALPMIWRSIDLRVQKNGTLEGGLASRQVATELQALRRHSGLTHRKGFLADELSLFGVDQSADHALVEIGNSQPTLVAPHPFAHLDAALGTERDPDALVATGIVTEGRKGQGGTLRRPLVDASTGYVSGSFGLFDVKQGAETLVHKPEIQRRGGVIVDAAVNGTNLAVLYRLPDGALHVSRSIAGAMSDEQICTMSGMWPLMPSAPTRPVVTEEPELGHAGNLPISAVWYSSSEARSSQLIVRFHGGPAVSILESVADPTLPRLIGTQNDILDVEYPSSSGLGQKGLAAVRERGPAVLEDTAQSIMKWAKAAGYSRIVLWGESFGAIPAYAAARHPEGMQVRVVLVVPVTKLDPNRTIPGTPWSKDITSIQVAMEQAALGSAERRAEVSAWVKGLFNLECPDVPVFAFFAAVDAIAPHTATEAACIDRRGKVSVIPRTEHTTILTSPSFWADVQPSLR